MSLEIPAGLALELIRDPVMAAKLVMAAELDVFQASRFRLGWFTPILMDHSGVSTGKTEEVFLLSFLRCILLPNPPGYIPRIDSVYYQGLGTAEEVFLPKIEKYCEKSNIFERQLKVQRGGKFYRSLKGCFLIEGRAGWKVELPAGDFLRDSKNQASKRFNDLYVDETGEIDAMGKGINTQLLQRNTLECFNPHHPVWCNHTLFLGHAESPDHPYHKRFTNLKKRIRRGSQNHAVVTSNCYDYSGASLKKYGQEAIKKAEDQKGQLTESEFAWIWLGEWKRGSKGWYSVAVREGILRPDILPLFARPPGEDGTLFTLGGDFAPGRTSNADFNSYVVTAATAVDGATLPPDFDRTGLVEIRGTLWFQRLVYAVFLHGKTVDALSGVIHLLHRAFGFSGIGLDSGGGGAWVYSKLVENRQFIENQWKDAQGLCTPADSMSWPEAEPVVHFYDRSDPQFRALFGQRYVLDNTGPVDFLHTHVRAAMMKADIAVPSPVARRGPAAGLITPEQAETLGVLEKILDQFGAIGVKVDKQGVPLLSENRFRKFTAGARKKDGAMAAGYSIMTMKSVLERRESRTAASSTFKLFS